MFEFLFPFFVLAAISAEMEGSAEVAVLSDAVVGPTTGERTPEEQVASGKFTTALEIRPILDATKGSWVAVRDYNGQDLVYFTHLMSWRCGLWDIHYGVNGAAPDTLFEMEPCNLEYAQPNAMIDIENFLPYITLPQGSVQSVSVAITYDDGTSDTATFERGAVLIP
jgi:hypothetical protein